MFNGLLNRVKADLVRIYVKYDIWRPINRQQGPTAGTGQVSVHL